MASGSRSPGNTNALPTRSSIRCPPTCTAKLARCVRNVRPVSGYAAEASATTPNTTGAPQRHTLFPQLPTAPSLPIGSARTVPPYAANFQDFFASRASFPKYWGRANYWRSRGGVMASSLDYYDIESLLSDDERIVRDTARKLVEEEYLPIVRDAFRDGYFPKQVIPRIASLGFLGSNLPEKYGCAGLNNVAYGLINQELERGDSGLRSFVSVQSSLVMYPIYAFGSEAQKL